MIFAWLISNKRRVQKGFENEDKKFKQRGKQNKGQNVAFLKGSLKTEFSEAFRRDLKWA